MVSFQGLELSSHGITLMRVTYNLRICSGIRLMRKGRKESTMIDRKMMIRKEWAVLEDGRGANEAVDDPDGRVGQM